MVRTKKLKEVIYFFLKINFYLETEVKPVELMELKQVRTDQRNLQIYFLHSSETLKPKTVRIGIKYIALFVESKERKRDSQIMIYKQVDSKDQEPNHRTIICSLRIGDYVPLNIDDDFFDMNYFFREIDIQVDENNEVIHNKNQPITLVDPFKIKTIKEEVLVVVNPNDGSLRYFRIEGPKIKFFMKKPGEAKNFFLKLENIKSSVELEIYKLYREPVDTNMNKPSQNSTPAQVIPSWVGKFKIWLIILGVLVLFGLIALFAYFQAEKERLKKIKEQEEVIYDLTEYHYDECWF